MPNGKTALRKSSSSSNLAPKKKASTGLIREAVLSNYLFLFALMGALIMVGIFVVLSGHAAVANPLSFDLPSQSALKSSPKKVFAHYFTPYPISQDNQPYATDYYAKNFLTPSGLSQAWYAEGGMLRDRPIPRNPITSSCNYPVLSAASCYVYQDMKTEVFHATTAGLDGFTVDVLGNSGQNWERMKALIMASSAEDSNFKIMLMPDGNGSAVAAGYASLADHLAGLAKDPATKDTLYRLTDGSLVIAPFKPETEGPAYWQNFIAAMKANGVPVAFVPCFLNYGANVSDYSSFSYGFSNWGNRNPSQNGSLAANIKDAHARKKIWMQPVSLQDTRPDQHVYDEALNSENFRTTWAAAIDNDAEWVQIPTWNDYSEGAQIAPSSHLGWGPLDLASYYIARFKSPTNSWPKIVRDVIYISHRIQFANTAPSSLEGNTSLMKLRGGSSPARDKVEVLSFLTQAASIKATVGGIATSIAVPAGVTPTLFDLHPGQVSAMVIRSGVNILSVTSDFTVKSSFTKQDEGYYYASSGRTGVTYVIPTPSPTPTSSPSPTPVSGVDLVVTSIAWNPGNPAVGATATFDAVIKNQGSVASPPGIIHGISFRIDGKSVAWSDNNTTSLAPGASRDQIANSGPVGAPGWTATAGTHIVEAIIDDVHRIIESNDANNTLSSTLTPGSPADLIVTDISWQPISSVTGSKITFSATITNQGLSASQSGIIHGIRFSVDGVPVSWSDDVLVSLEPGSSRMQKANNGPLGTSFWTSTSGTHAIEAYADDIGRLIEASKTNNRLTISLTQ